MKSVNKVILLGNATRDAESCTHNGKPACAFGLATHRTHTDAQGARCSLVEFSRVIVVGSFVSTCLDVVKKGKPIYLEGFLKTEDGTTWIIVEELVLLAPSAGMQKC
jgi:single-strand DNA-binding protein